MPVERIDRLSLRDRAALGRFALATSRVRYVLRELTSRDRLAFGGKEARFSVSNGPPAGMGLSFATRRFSRIRSPNLVY
jgi:hypothetical protein